MKKKLETMPVDVEMTLDRLCGWLQRLAADYHHVEGFPTEQVMGAMDDGYFIQDLMQPNGGYVYMLVADVPGKNLVKIGRTKHISNRMTTLGIQIPFTIFVGLVITTGNMYETESALHQLFAEYRTKGEWFEVPVLRDCILAIIDSGFTYYVDERVKSLTDREYPEDGEIKF